MNSCKLTVILCYYRNYKKKEADVAGFVNYIKTDDNRKTMDWL